MTTAKSKKTVRLFKFSEEHLYYEIRMLYEITDILAQGKYKTPTDMRYTRVLENALIESFVTHASIILDFLYNKKIKPDDAIASDYVIDKKKWRSKLPPYGDDFKEILSRRNKELAHLSYKRLDVTRESKTWYYFRITEQIKEIVNVFLLEASPKFIGQKMYSLRSESK